MTTIPIAIAGLIEYIKTTDEPTSPVTLLSMNVEDHSNGNWTIRVIRGSYSISNIILQVINQTNGDCNVQKVLINTTQSYNDPDILYNDNNENSKLDLGDSILLKSSGGNIKPGNKVQLILRDNVIGTIRELPG